jgi:hypothetical protein
MRIISTLCVIALAASLAGCVSYSRHEREERVIAHRSDGYHAERHHRSGGYYGRHDGHYRHHDRHRGHDGDGGSRGGHYRHHPRGR